MSIQRAVSKSRRSLAKSLGRISKVDLYAIQDDPVDEFPNYVIRRLDAVVSGAKRRGPDGGREDRRILELFDKVKIRIGDYFLFNGNRLTVTAVVSEYPDEADGSQWLPKVTVTRTPLVQIMFGRPMRTVVDGVEIRDDGNSYVLGCDTFNVGDYAFPFLGRQDNLYRIDCIGDYSVGEEYNREGVEVGVWDAQYTLPYVGFIKDINVKWNMWDMARCVKVDIQSIQPEFSSEIPTVTIESRFSDRVTP